MRQSIAFIFGFIALSYGAVASAECPRPKIALQIPDGATAEAKDMEAAQRSLIAMDQQVGEYLRCLKGEASQQQVGKDEAARTRVAEQFVASNNAVVDELAGLADCFNAQLEVLRKQAPGTKIDPAKKENADCASFKNAATTAAAAAPPPSVRGDLIREAEGNSIPVGDGAWNYSLIRDETPRRCGAQGEQICIERSVYVRNGSSQILECKGYISYEGADAEGRPSVDGRAVVNERSVRRVVGTLAPRGVNAKTFDAECKVRAPLPPLDTPASCKYEVVKPIQISDYYPPTARRAGEEGPVTVEFTVNDKAANPTDVKVIGSSLSPTLDQGAVEAVKAMVMKSSCGTKRYRLRLAFQLEG
jgi:TonB family protein